MLSASKTIVLGIDGGASHTRCVCVADDGRVLGVAAAGPANYLRVGLEVAVRNVVEAAGVAAQGAGVRLPAEVACVCLAGAGREEDRARLIGPLEATGIGRRIVLATDAEAVLAGAHALRPGIVVLAGTGAVVWGRNAQGEMARADGWGPPAGDEVGRGGSAGRCCGRCCAPTTGAGRRRS